MADERLHQLFHDARQGAGHRSSEVAGRRHRRGREAQRHDHRRRARGAGHRRSTSSRSPRPTPVLAVAIHAKSKGDEDKLANALHRLQDEDPVLRIERNPETHQTLLSGMGETHLSIALEKLARKFGVEVETEDVQVPYRETITGTAEAEGKLKKQTGGHGQFAVAWLRVEPDRARRGHRVRRRDRRRRDPAPVHPRGREGRRRDRRARRRARLPRRRREGHVLRRQAPPRRQLRDGVQDRGVTRVQGGAGARPARSCSSRSASSS